MFHRFNSWDAVYLDTYGNFASEACDIFEIKVFSNSHLNITYKISRNPRNSSE